MGRAYDIEMGELSAAARHANLVDVEELRRLISFSGRPAVFAASGGALAAARLEADLHEHVTGQFARDVTPLELTSLPGAAAGGAVLLTASGRHPDALSAVGTMASAFQPAVVVSTNPADKLREVCARAHVPLVDLGNPSLKDGFLATNSLIVMMIALIRSYLPESPGNGGVLFEQRTSPAPATRDVLVLVPPKYHAVASDIEARLNETGLASVQIADYRNFGHGRHYGLSRRIDDTTVLAIIAEPYEQLARATLALLPQEVAVIELATISPWPWSVVDLVVQSMLLTRAAGALAGLDPGRPRVPAWGRQLYRLPARRLVPGTPKLAPVGFKMREIGPAAATDKVRAIYEEALLGWTGAARKHNFGGIVLDYDGTVCTTAGRFEPPEPSIQAELRRLLDEGCVIGFASGRGDSLHAALRDILPRKLWPQVLVGLYNGGLLLPLQEPFPKEVEASPVLAAALERIQTLPLAGELTLRPGSYQLRVEPLHHHQLPTRVLAQLITTALRRDTPLPVEIAASAHSVDVHPDTSSKIRVVDHLADKVGSPLTIGDQGHYGGNDFAMLAHTPWSLSVDRCSADPTRCWRLGADAASGPDLLLRYLRALTRRHSGFRLGPVR